MTETELPESRDKTILIVDDDENIRELLGFIVKKEGFRFDTAVNGREGIEKVRKVKPDLILLDLMLPEVSGFEVLRQLQVGETRDIPIIVITGRYMDRSTAEMIGREPNVVEFMEKPIRSNMLGGVLHRILKTRPPGGAESGVRQ